MITLNELRKELTRYTYPDNSKEVKRLREENAEMLEALKEIAKMEGPYSRDPLTHAENVIENLTNIANKAIAKVEGE